MNQYVFIIDEKGKFITSIVDNSLNEQDLMNKAKRDCPTGADYIYSADGDTMLDEFLAGKLYVNGEFVEPPVPTATRAERIAEIRQYYEARFAKLDEMLVRRRLSNTGIEDLQEQYATIKAEMMKRIKEVK